MNTLAERRCVPCRRGTPPLTDAEIAPLLAQLEGWQIEEGFKLARAYRFKNFVEAVAFVNLITPIAEEEGHHPDLYVRWGQVRVWLWTHAINGLSESDFILAAKLDRALAAAR